MPVIDSHFRDCESANFLRHPPGMVFFDLPQDCLLQAISELFPFKQLFNMVKAHEAPRK